MVLPILQVIFAVLLITAILMQQKGTGLGAAFGGGGTMYKSKKRGGEKVLYIATIVFALIFFGLLVADIFIV
ncbi:MAG: preprotein translocase subunit SecG [Parcubacteria group bacterium CG10_big_fil_rev_8_21_14_0_10_46_32]|nr:MAG: preprotein translocase subunit SecG [Parcubacteria group bacterium CG10_big_fil_rev_8_21_14_0_10_46_32]